MPRLRTTATLSLLALAIGVAGTQWLSEQTYARAQWPVAMHRATTAHMTHHIYERAGRTSMTARPRYVPARTEAAAAATIPAEETTLTPLSMPMASLPTSQMENHATGNLVLHLTVDGQGQVTRAAIAQSSGDEVLDANAMKIAQHWRFAVPADHPQGISGDLPLRFAGAPTP